MTAGESKIINKRLEDLEKKVAELTAENAKLRAELTTAAVDENGTTRPTILGTIQTICRRVGIKVDTVEKVQRSTGILSEEEFKQKY